MELRKLKQHLKCLQTLFRRFNMVANIVMEFDDDKCVYGTYPFNSSVERNYVNELAMQIRDERGCRVYVERLEENV